MVDEEASPSAGWREVYERMGVEQPDAEDDEEPERCPDCGLVLADEHNCPLADDESDLNVEVVAPLREPGESD